MRLLRLSSATAAALLAAGAFAAPATAAAPAVTLSPASLSFADQAIGTTSAAQSVTVTNSGDANLFINSARIGGTDPADFVDAYDGCSGLTLTPGTSCTMSVAFAPIATGTRSGGLVITDNAGNSPQTAAFTGNGTGTNPPLAITTQFFSCTGGSCDIGAGHNVFVNNFFTTTFEATGGTAPYSWSGQPPAGLTLRPSGLLVGAPTTLGAASFTATVTDAAGATATGSFTLTVTGPPAPSPNGCQTGGKPKEALSGPSFNGQAPTGTATVDESRFSGCGGFSVLSVTVSKVNVPDGTQLWATLDFQPVGTITVNHGSGTMTPDNLGRFGVSRDQIRIYSSLPDVGSFQQILSGGSFIQ